MASASAGVNQRGGFRNSHSKYAGGIRVNVQSAYLPAGIVRGSIAFLFRPFVHSGPVAPTTGPRLVSTVLAAIQGKPIGDRFPEMNLGLAEFFLDQLESGST